MNETKRIRISGLVQGIGFRPYIAELAEKKNLKGQVKNTGGMVEILISGEKSSVSGFIENLQNLPHTGELPNCRIDRMWVETVQADVPEGFFIVSSVKGHEKRRLLPVDLAVCDRCVSELHDPSNYRYRYPLISCTSCGPRFSIQRSVPYDRDSITMSAFDMCDVCRQEYEQKGNIRRHAQTIACKNCGPTLHYTGVDGWKEAVSAFSQGKIGAVRDIGGYHFAFSPFHVQAAERLRTFKHRDKKPFAVMFSNMEEILEYCEVSDKEAEILRSSIRPIVLLKKKKDFPADVCGTSDRIGAMLPCNPLQILLLEETGPLVMTSGNRGGESILISEEQMLSYIGHGIDFMISHDRGILTPLDDSIYQVTKLDEKTGKYAVQVIRRARGLTPEPIHLQRRLPQDTFAAGGDLKAVFAIGTEDLVYPSQYFGDLEDVRCMQSRENGRKHMEELLDIRAQISIADLHPGYISAKGITHKVQHHHAHICSVIAEHGLQEKVLGIACDGTGYGTDGTIWGSEFLLCENEKMKRCGHFSQVRLLGADASAKQADLTLFSYLMEARERGFATEPLIKELMNRAACNQADIDKAARHFRMQEMAWKQGINTAISSSMGRLFDAAAALLDICHCNSYEGECAVLLEQAAHKAVLKPSGTITVHVEKKDGRWQADSISLLMDLYAIRESYPKEELAYIFHHAIAQAITEIAQEICREEQVQTIALSGGTFCNRILLKEVMGKLSAMGKEVCINEKVPCGDGGIALGQMYLATFLTL